MKTTRAIFVPDTRAWNARAWQPVGKNRDGESERTVAADVRAGGPGAEPALSETLR